MEVRHGGSGDPGLADGRRGLGATGGRVRHAERAGELPRVRRPAPAPGGRAPATGSSTWPAGPGWPSSWPPPAGPPAPASTPPPGWSRWRGTGSRRPTCGSATCTSCPGRTRASTWSPASAGSGAPPRTRSPRCAGCCVPGGRLGLTVWGHLKASPGAWALRPFTLASRAAGREPGGDGGAGPSRGGEELLARSGFVDVRRVEVPCVWEFADPAAYARALASTGPAYEAIQTVGEEAFAAYAEELARERVRAGLPLRAEIAVVGYLARTPVGATPAPQLPARSGADPRGAAVVRRGRRRPRLRDERLAGVGAPARRARRRCST